MRYAPSGDVFVAFVKDRCSGVGTHGTCDWDSAAHAGSGLQAGVGRMVHGVWETWGEANSADPEAGSVRCDSSDGPKQNACVERVSSEGICEELTSCICNHCHCELDKCDADPEGKLVRMCATQNNCRNIDCLVPCGDTSYAAGELMASRALGVANCANANGCPASCP